jgi:hypothetical protein
LTKKWKADFKEEREGEVLRNFTIFYESCILEICCFAKIAQNLLTEQININKQKQ